MNSEWYVCFCMMLAVIIGEVSMIAIIFKGNYLYKTKDKELSIGKISEAEKNEFRKEIINLIKTTFEEMSVVLRKKEQPISVSEPSSLPPMANQ